MVEVADGVTNLCCWVEAEVLRRAGGTPHRFLASALRENSHLGLRLQSVEQVWPIVDDHQFYVWENCRPGGVRTLEHR